MCLDLHRVGHTNFGRNGVGSVGFEPYAPNPYTNWAHVL